MNKKGFTLLELLAVIIVLALLALIAIPIVTKIIKNAEKKALEESAFGFVQALNEEIINSDFSSRKKINNGYYYTFYLKDEYNFEIGGSYPLEDSWVKIEKGEVTDYSLKFKKDVITRSNGNITIGKTISSHDDCFTISGNQVCYEK